MAEPSPGDQLEALAVEEVDPLASASLDPNQSAAFELLQVAARRGPRAIEAGGDLPGGHLTTAEVQDEKDLPAGRVRKPGKDLVEVLELLLGGASAQTRASGCTCGNSMLGRPLRRSVSLSIGSQIAITSGCSWA